MKYAGMDLITLKADAALLIVSLQYKPKRTGKLPGSFMYPMFCQFVLVFRIVLGNLCCSGCDFLLLYI